MPKESNGKQKGGVHMTLESRKTGMNGTGMKGISRSLLRGFTWAGKAALFCLGLLAMLTLVVMMIVLAAVMLAATILPGAKPELVLRHRRGSGNASEFAAPQKAVVS